MAHSGVQIGEGFFTTSGGAGMFYRDLAPAGDQRTVPLLCLHGFVRNSRDFVTLGQHLAGEGTRVIAPDLRGRGFSPRYAEAAHYHVDHLLQDVWDLLDHLAVDRFAVLGTALGGIMGMTMAASHPGRARGLVLNDLGAEIGEASAKHDGGYANNDEYSFDEAVERIKTQFASALPDLPPARWPELTRRAYREQRPGRWVRDFDMLALTDAVRMKRENGERQLWPLFLATRGVPVAVLRGALSGFLPEEVAQAMLREHPGMVLSTIPRRGHPPLLDEPESLAAIRALLRVASQDAGDAAPAGH